MNKEELIDKILSDLYINSNRGMDFLDDFCVYENDINKLESAKNIMEKEGLITTFKNLKTGISPLGFKICFEGGYLENKIKKERQIRQAFQKNKREITYLRRKLKSKDRINTFLLVLTVLSFLLVILMSFGLLDLSFRF